MEYHKENREKYLAYMREYNKQYWLKHRPEPKPKKVKEVKPKKEPKEKKPPKPVKQRREKKESWFAPPEPVLLKVETGNFILTFD